jgi:hypothetical protein
MKHLKFFENNSDFLWLVVYINHSEDNESEYRLFNNIENAENYFLKLINDIKEIRFANKGKEMSQIDIITDVNSAVDYFEDELVGLYTLYISEMEVEDEFDLPGYIKVARDSKKYNI